MTPPKRVLLVSVPAPAVKQTGTEIEYWKWHYALRARLVYPNLSERQLALLGESENQNVGLLSIANTLAKRGIKVDYLAPSLAYQGIYRDLYFNQKLLGLIAKWHYDLIGFSAHTCAIPKAIELAREVKVWQPEARTVIGGPHVNGIYGSIEAARERTELETSFDIVIPGRGEQALLSHLDVEASIPAFEDYPSSDNRFLNVSELPAARIFTALGCRKGQQCVFCADRLHTKRFNRRPLKFVSDELAWLYAHKGTRYFYLGDENFLLEPSHTREVLSVLTGLPDDARFGCQARVESVNEDVISELSRTGRFTEVQLGIESASQSVLNLNKKGLRIERAREACLLIKRYGLQTLGYFLVGLPGETEETAEMTIRMMEELLREGSLDFVEYRSVIPFPGTPMWDQAERYDVQIRHRKWELYRGENLPPFDLENLTAQQIRRYYLWGVSRITTRYKERYRKEYPEEFSLVGVQSAVTEGGF